LSISYTPLAFAPALATLERLFLLLQLQRLYEALTVHYQNVARFHLSRETFH
jgi:hypothetical protein